ADRRRRIGNSFEGHRGALDRAANGALLGAGDIGAGGAACGLRRCDHREKADDDEGECSSDERHGVPPKRAFDTIVVPEYPALQGVERRRPISNATVGIRPVASTAVSAHLPGVTSACGTSRTSGDVRLKSAKRAKADIGGQVTFTNR